MNRTALPVSLVAGRRSKFVALAFWVVLVLALGPLAGRFESVQQNEPSSFLPEGAESVAVLEASDRFPAGDATPAIAVFRAADGLDAASQDAIEQARRRVSDAGLEGVGALPPTIASQDGKAAILTVPIEAGGEEDVLIGAVDDVRALVREDLPPGLEVRVTGPRASRPMRARRSRGSTRRCFSRPPGLSSCCSSSSTAARSSGCCHSSPSCSPRPSSVAWERCWPRQGSSSTGRRAGSCSSSCSAPGRTTRCS